MNGDLGVSGCSPMTGLLWIAALVGCYPAVPSNEIVEPPAQEDYARRVVWHAWQRAFNGEGFLGIPLPPLDIEIVWMAGDCLIVEDDNTDGCCILGLYHDHDDTIFLVKQSAISGSRLGHETLHYYMDWLATDPDAEHHSVAWLYVGYVDEALRAAGL